MKRLSMCIAAGVAVLGCGVTSAMAGVISDGSFSVGIGPNGELYDSGTGTGFVRTADGLDPLAPGTPRDSWGISANGSAASADAQFTGASGIVSTTSVYNPNSAQLITTTSLGLVVTQTYSFVAGNVLLVNTTVTNAGSSTATGVLFQRDVDWDVAPTAFNETSSAPPIAGYMNVVDSSFNGFESPSPLTGFASSCASGCNNTGDNGGGIRIALGDLAPGDTVLFNYFYGINNIEQSPAGLISEVQGLGAGYFVATQSSDGGTNSAILAVETPEPSTLAFMLIGVGMTAFGLRRRRAAQK